MSSEHRIQNEIRNALTDEGLFFRANVGRAWTGDQAHRMCNGRDVLITNARPFDSGLPPGFSDIFGLVPIEVTPEHVGRVMAQFAAIEVKTATGRANAKQNNFLGAVQREGGISGIARTVDDALQLIKDAHR